jgi:hypothetical protein
MEYRENEQLKKHHHQMTTVFGALGEASKETQTAPVPLITGEISPMEELRMGFGPVQVSWKYLHDLKGQILDLKNRISFMELQKERSMFYLKKEVVETIAYREKYEGALRELEKQKCDTAHAEECCCFLGKKLEKMKTELSEMGIALIEEKNNHSELLNYTNRVLQENDRLKMRVNQLEAVQSETRTQLGAYTEEARAPMTPVSVPLSPREPHEQHGNPNTPRLWPETPETASDGDGEEQESMSPTIFNYMEEMTRLNYGRRESESSATTDCSGDPICLSD